jgi:hypothetical protein
MAYQNSKFTLSSMWPDLTDDIGQRLIRAKSMRDVWYNSHVRDYILTISSAFDAGAMYDEIIRRRTSQIVDDHLYDDACPYIPDRPYIPERKQQSL